MDATIPLKFGTWLKYSWEIMHFKCFFW